MTAPTAEFFGASTPSPSRPSKSTEVFVFGQGRSGSTLVIRLLNSVPETRVCGENQRALDGLRTLYDAFKHAQEHQQYDFGRLAWKVPCGQERVLELCREFFRNLYNPQGAYRIYGFKEIRYGHESYEQLCDDLGFIKLLCPHAKFIFNTRQTEAAVKSAWWAHDPDASTETLDRSRRNFDRYVREHQDCYLVPYEELVKHSPVLRGMFEFLGVAMPAVERELETVLR
jgi:hypothetical protein